MKLEQVFLEIAKKDLEAAKCLLDKNLYPHSVFHVQQGIEKAVKSLGIFNKTVTEDEARESIGHEATRIYIKVAEQQKERIEKLERLLVQSPQLKRIVPLDSLQIAGLKHAAEALQKELSSRNALRTGYLTNDQLHNTLETIRLLKEEYDREALRIDQDFIRTMTSESGKEGVKQYLREAFQTLSQIRQGKPMDPDELETALDGVFGLDILSIYAKVFKGMLRASYCAQALLYLSLVFSGHAVATRYPRGIFNPMLVYDDRMPLVLFLNRFIEAANDTLSQLDRSYAEATQSP